MSVFAKMIGEAGGAAVGETVKGVGSAIGGLARDLRAAFTGQEVISEETKIKLAEIADRLEQREKDLALAQVDVNKLEAQNPNLFVSGWRPFIGWVCGVSLACYFIPKYLLAAIFWIRASWAAQVLVAYPVDGVDLLQLVLAMLGMATLRTIEKHGSVARVK
jgi:hypothetical protein